MKNSITRPEYHIDIVEFNNALAALRHANSIVGIVNKMIAAHLAGVKINAPQLDLLMHWADMAAKFTAEAEEMVARLGRPDNYAPLI